MCNSTSLYLYVQTLNYEYIMFLNQSGGKFYSMIFKTCFASPTYYSNILAIQQRSGLDYIQEKVELE